MIVSLAAYARITALSTRRERQLADVISHVQPAGTGVLVRCLWHTCLLADIHGDETPRSRRRYAHCVEAR